MIEDTSLIGTVELKNRADAVAEQEVVLANRLFRAVVSNTLNQGYNVPTRKTDAEYADHISKEGAEFSLLITVRRDDVTSLRTLADAMERVEFFSEFGYFDNMVIRNFKVRTSDNIDTREVTFDLKQVRVGRTKKVNVVLSLPETEKDDIELDSTVTAVPDTIAPGSTSNQNLVEKRVQDAPQIPTTKKTLYERAATKPAPGNIYLPSIGGMLP
ncbi:phage baseplate protein [Methanoregula sp.]|uniref:phage baseplate protein n=1 Tax=Methanoregula sp. TaxID=2052170 RepID=UPI000CC9CA56|nr:hypothetical protein [Methanoregula sp.]PKG31861.1 MAG: hypothetical protein CW742_11165 [Methanoregula sp.]